MYDLPCPVDGAVVGLQQQGNNVSGTVDAGFYGAALAPLSPTLQYLFLRGNSLRGPLSLMIKGMRDLHVISLSG